MQPAPPPAAQPAPRPAAGDVPAADPAPSTGRGVDRALYALVCLLAVLLSLWCLLLVPLRVAGVVAPVSLVAAPVVGVALAVAGARVVRAAWGAVAPALLWALPPLLASAPGPGGDVLLSGGRGTAYVALAVLGSLAGWSAALASTATAR